MGVLQVPLQFKNPSKAMYGEQDPAKLLFDGIKISGDKVSAGADALFGS